MLAPRPLLLGLLLLTLMVRGLLPVVHGGLLAKTSGNPALAAYCGTNAAVLIAQTQAQAPWLAELDTNSFGDLNESTACPLCVSAAAALLLLAFALLLLAVRMPDPRPVTALCQRQIDAFLRPPARAPPPAFPLAIPLTN